MARVLSLHRLKFREFIYLKILRRTFWGYEICVSIFFRKDKTTFLKGQKRHFRKVKPNLNLCGILCLHPGKCVLMYVAICNMQAAICNMLQYVQIAYCNMLQYAHIAYCNMHIAAYCILRVVHPLHRTLFKDQSDGMRAAYRKLCAQHLEASRSISK